MNYELLISVHIPKTGGTSFAKILEKVYAEALHFDYPWAPIEPSLGLRGCIHGHFSATKYAEMAGSLGPRAAMITWLRDPVERAISTYYFLRDLDVTPQKAQPPWEVDAKTLSMHDFFLRGHARNEMVRQLCAAPIENFAFVGITERFEESMRRFSNIMGIEIDTSDLPRERRNEGRRSEHYEADQRTLDLLERENYLDIPLYKRALALFDQAPGAQYR